MDVKKTPKTTAPNKSKVFIGGVLFCLLIALAWFAKSKAGTSIQRTDILVGTVQQGDLRVEIEGYGNLRSDKLQLITSLTRATVKEIILKPGAPVTKDSVIVRLENPELQQQVDNAQQELVQRQANLRQLKLNQQRELLNETASLAEISASYETARLRLAAQEDLVKSGIVSTLSYKETQQAEAQLKQRIAIHQERATQLKLVHQEAINIQQEQIKQQQGQLAITTNRLNSLEVTAGFDGVLQQLTVELGQSLAAGEQIALVGSVRELIAMIKVPQNQAQQIQLGQQAIIDTRRDKITGTVARIDPMVENNTVNVEISLPADLPASARPQLNVDGVILIETLSNVAYIERPANIKGHSQAQLYKLDSAQQQGQLTALTFGQEAGRYIEVINGGQPSEQFIVSDLSQLGDSHPTLSIN